MIPLDLAKLEAVFQLLEKHPHIEHIETPEMVIFSRVIKPQPISIEQQKIIQAVEKHQSNEPITPVAKRVEEIEGWLNNNVEE